MKKFVLLLGMFSVINGAQMGLSELQQEKISENGQDQQSVNGLLIFLDESERNRIGAISMNFISAILQNAGPILISTSLINNIINDDIYTDKTPEELIRLYNNTKTFNPSNEEIDKELKKIILSINDFKQILNENWIIKQINSYLSLLLPKTFLQKKEINLNDLNIYTSENIITDLEYKLGLKVNHMKTIDISEIKESEQFFESAGYFSENVWDMFENKSNIFVINQEYRMQNKFSKPTWIIYINGHGSIRSLIASLYIYQFQDFLNFLETKITTKFLIYSSCYAAGMNADLIYTDAEEGIHKTYQFPIVVQALTDAPTIASSVEPIIEDGKLKLITPTNYAMFLEKIDSNIINYDEIIESLKPKIKPDAISDLFELLNLSQIKFPGLTWFSVHDINNKTASINSVLAKSRKEPLHIKKFFKRKQIEPIGILLNTEVVPFEIVIDTTNVPKFISMVPGETVHFIKKISSKQHSIIPIYLGFSLAHDLPRKIFIIDQVEVSQMTPLFKVVIVVDGKKIDYYDQSSIGTVYKNFKEANIDEQKEYHSILQKYDKPKEPLEVVEKYANDVFSRKMNAEEAYENIKDVLSRMPKTFSMIRIPKLIGSPCGFDNNCWLDMLSKLTSFEIIDQPKRLQFNEIEICDENNNCNTLFTDVYIIIERDINWKYETRIFYKDAHHENPKEINKGYILDIEDYVPSFSMEDYILEDDDYEYIDESDIIIEPIQTQLTREAIANIESALKQQYTKASVFRK